jgi:hypothetical protein
MFVVPAGAGLVIPAAAGLVIPAAAGLVIPAKAGIQFQQQKNPPAEATGFRAGRFSWIC